MSMSDARISELTQEIDINATPDAIWQLLTNDIGSWWPAEFYAGGVAGKRRLIMEAVPGGRLHEEWDDGGGILWATVVGVEPGKRLQVIGYSFPNWGGPSQWFGSWELSARDNRTRLRFSEHAIGRVTDDYLADKDKGWNFLWALLKARLEGTALPVWQE